MSKITTTLSLVTALLSGGGYEPVSANSVSTSPKANTSVVQSMETSEENKRITMDARIAMGKELRQ